MNNPNCHTNRFARRLLAGVLSASVSLSGMTPVAVFADGKPDVLGEKSGQVTGEEINAGQKAAVEKGLEWLAKTQAADGSYSNGAGGMGAIAGITSLAGLAFMANGNLPGRGKYGDNVKKAMNFVIRNQQESGQFSGSRTMGEMYSHGFATLFIAEIYGMNGDDEIKENLQKAVRLIENCQNNEGGWRYAPVKADADISVTICQVMALRAARDAGIKVEDSIIEKAGGDVKKCQNPDGSFNYMASMGGGMGGGFARTGAGTAALFYAGAFQDKAVEKGVKWLSHVVPSPNNPGGNEGNFFYGNYYACQAMYLAGGDYWKAWYPGIRDVLIKRQVANGNWTGDVDDSYATAMALIILQMPNRYLPVFNGKGPGS